MRPPKEWLVVWCYDTSQPAPVVDAALAMRVAQQLVGGPELKIGLIIATTWTVNNCFASHRQKGWVFIIGDASHCHLP